MNEYAGYPLFKEVKSPTLRAWNRLNIIFNIKELIRNNALSVKYFDQFSHKEKLNIWALVERVKKEGFENVRRSLIRNAR